MDYLLDKGKSILQELFFRPGIHPFHLHSPIRWHTRGEPLRCPRHWDLAGNTQADLCPGGTCHLVGGQTMQK